MIQLPAEKILINVNSLGDYVGFLPTLMYSVQKIMFAGKICSNDGKEILSDPQIVLPPVVVAKVNLKDYLIHKTPESGPGHVNKYTKKAHNRVIASLLAEGIGHVLVGNPHVAIAYSLKQKLMYPSLTTSIPVQEVNQDTWNFVSEFDIFQPIGSRKPEGTIDEVVKAQMDDISRNIQEAVLYRCGPFSKIAWDYRQIDAYEFSLTLLQKTEKLLEMIRKMANQE
jgi:hypothetical protein